MIIHDVVQGSPEWHALRAKYDTASEASAMMGCSKHTKRGELLRIKATGSEKEISAWRQRNLLDRGHGIEAKARPIAEKIMGGPLYPITASSEEHARLLGSFDGVTLTESEAWECKSWNEEKAKAVRSGVVPEEDYWQCVQLLVVSEAERLLYMVTDGTPERTVYVWMELDEGDAALLLAGWEQFNADRAAYKAEPVAAEVVADPVSALPAIRYQVNGMVLTSNLDAFRARAVMAVELSKKKVETDQDFANLDALCKSFADAEKRLLSVRDQVLGEFKDVDAFCRDLAAIGEMMRQARLAGEKQVKTRKDEIRNEIREKAERDLAEHIAELDANFTGRVRMPLIEADFVLAMKGKRTVATLQEAADTELARAKVDANMRCERMLANLAKLNEKAKGFEFLFRDAQELAQKDAEVLELVIDQRIREHQELLAKQEEERRATEEAAKAAAEEPAANADPEPEALAPVVSEPEPESVPDPVIPTERAMRATIVNKLELLKAVLNGEVPDHVLVVDTVAVSELCADLGRSIPGVTWGAA
jgi:predicted phage-related endonuclease